MTMITPPHDDWPYTPYKLNEYGLVENQEIDLELISDGAEKSILNLARFLFFNANDGEFEDIAEAANEVLNIMRGEYYISNTDGDDEQ